MTPLLLLLLTPCAALAAPCCFVNADLSQPSPTNASLPLGWSTSGASSHFRWVHDYGEPAVAPALEIVGGAGRWTTKLVLPDGSVGQTLKIRFQYRSANATVRAHPKYGGCARATGLLSTDEPSHVAPNKAQNASQLVSQSILCYGKAQREGRWMSADMGDFVLPAAATTAGIWFSVWLVDLPSEPGGFAPAVLWATGFGAVLAPPPPPPAGSALLLAGNGSVWSLWSEHANHKVLPWALPPPISQSTVPQSTLQLSAAAGERTAIQLALRSPGLWGRWAWSGWAEPQAVKSGVRVSLQQVGFVNLTDANTPYGTAGWAPDPLTPLRLGNATALGDVFLHCADKVRPAEAGVQTCVGGSTQSFWLGITVPVGTPAGNYTATLSLARVPRGGVEQSIADVPLARVAIALRVHNFSIPTRPSVEIRSRVTLDWAVQFDNTIVRKCATADADGLHSCAPGCVIDTAGGGCVSNQSHFADYYQQVFNHRSIVGPEVGMGWTTLEPNGTLLGGHNAALYEQHLRYILANSPDPAHQQIHIMRSEFSAGLNQQHISCGEDGGIWAGSAVGVGIFTGSNFTVLSPQFRAWLPAVVSKYLAVLHRLGVAPNRALIKLSDEPYCSDPCTINAIRTVASFIRTHPLTRDVLLRIPGDVMGELLPFVNVWDQIASHSAMEWFAEEMAEAQAGGARLGIYNNDADVPDQPLLRTRAFALSLWNTSFVGALCWWSVNFWGPGWGTGHASGPQSFSGTVMYPPLPTRASPRSSLRWEALLDGLFDYERAALAHRLIDRVTALPASAERVAAVSAGRLALEGVRDVVWSFPLHSDLVVQPFTTAVAVVERHREAMTTAIEALVRAA
jgi:hypothetical protein